MASPEKQTAYIPMMTQGPDLNMSVEGLGVEQLIDFGKKLTYYSPYIIPFTFSSPFAERQLWKGLSIRNYIRTGVRPAALVFVEHENDLIVSNPSLTKPARLAAEIGRIEFKACDSCGDFRLYASILALMKGMLLDNMLHGRCLTPNVKFLQQSAIHGFDDPEILKGAKHVVDSARKALVNDSDQCKLDLLFQMLEQKDCMAKRMKQQFMMEQQILPILKQAHEMPMQTQSHSENCGS